MALIHVEGEGHLDPETGGSRGRIVCTGDLQQGAGLLPPAGLDPEMRLEGDVHTGPIHLAAPLGQVRLDFQVGRLPPPVHGIYYLAPVIPLPQTGPDAMLDLRVTLEAPEGWTLAGPRLPLSPARTLAMALGRGLPTATSDVAAGRPVHLEVVARPGGEAWNDQVLHGARQAMTFLARTLGPFPYPSMSLVAGDPNREGGTPLGPGLAVVHGGRPAAEPPQAWWPWIAAHEMVHQYFGEAIPEADHPGWVWLGLGLYVDWLFTQHHGLACRAHRRLVHSWLDRENLDLPCRLGGGPGGSAPHPGVSFHQAVLHGKAFAFFLALEARLGRPALGAVLRRLVRDHTGRPLGRAGLEQSCGAPDLFEAWVDHEIPPKKLPGSGLAVALALAGPQPR